MSQITSVKAREIIDSRGNPTIEVDIILSDGSFGRAAVPSGASTGIHEMLELRDQDKNRFNGYGVQNAVANVNESINPLLNGMSALDQNIIDRKLVEFDGTADSLIVRDIGSRNGTFVNGHRVEQAIPLCPNDLVQFSTLPFRVMRQWAKVNTSTANEDVIDKAMSLVQFDTLLNENAITAYYQPIVDLQQQNIVGYEALARSHVVGLEEPAKMFSAAAQLNLQTTLSDMVRRKSVQETVSINPPPHLFLNTHPAELGTRELAESMATIRGISTIQSITLEIHEAAVTDPNELNSLRAALRDLNIGLAFDDFGTGQARIAELAEVQPDYLKFDMSLIRGLHEASAERVRMIQVLVRMVRDIGIVSLAEGIETEQERNICAELGFELAQGFYFGRPFPLHHPSLRSES